MRKCGVIVSSDLGKTWDTSRLHESLGFDRKNGILLADMTVAEIGEGGLYAVFRPKVVVGGEDDGLVVRRTAKSMRLYTAISTDVGKTWTTPREMSSEMRTFDAAARLFRLQPKGPLVLAYNDRSNFDTLEGEDGVSDEEENDDDDDESIGSSSGSRSSETSKSSRSGSSSNSASFSDAATNLGALRLTLATSHDHGRTWRKVVTVRDGATTTSGNTNTDESSAFHRQQQQRKTLGLRVSQPWLLQHGCKAFVAFSRLSRVGIFLEVRASATGKRPRVGFTSQPRGDVILILIRACIINAVSGRYTFFCVLRSFLFVRVHFSFCLLFLPSNPSFITRTFNTHNYYIGKKMVRSSHPRVILRRALLSFASSLSLLRFVLLFFFRT